MLRIYPVILDWISCLPPAIRSIGACDRNLADHLRRSSTAVALNVAEGMGATGRVKVNAYRIALREMREAIVAIDIAMRLEYIAGPDDRMADRQDRIVGTLVRLARPRS